MVEELVELETEADGVDTIATAVVTLILVDVSSRNPHHSWLISVLNNSAESNRLFWVGLHARSVLLTLTGSLPLA